jgi:hypothetical protein
MMIKNAYLTYDENVVCAGCSPCCVWLSFVVGSITLALPRCRSHIFIVITVDFRVGNDAMGAGRSAVRHRGTGNGQASFSGIPQGSRLQGRSMSIQAVGFVSHITQVFHDRD